MTGDVSATLFDSAICYSVLAEQKHNAAGSADRSVMDNALGDIKNRDTFSLWI